MRRKRESGQALVLVLLSLAVVLTIVLFILSRSITDVSVSSGQADSVRAFSAAEAGIENALVIGTGSGTSTGVGSATYTSSVTALASTNNFVYPAPLLSGDSMTLWFVGHDSAGNMICDGSNKCFTGTSMNVCWGNSGTVSNTATTPAIEISIYYESTAGSTASAKIVRAAYDPNSSRTSSNSFASPDSGTCEDTSFAFQKSINFSDLKIPSAVYLSPNGLIFARIKLLYNTDVAHNVGVWVTGSALPSQGVNYSSTGSYGSSNRKINVFQGWPEFPFGGNSIFTPAGLTK